MLEYTCTVSSLRAIPFRLLLIVWLYDRPLRGSNGVLCFFVVCFYIGNLFCLFLWVHCASAISSGLCAIEICRRSIGPCNTKQSYSQQSTDLCYLKQSRIQTGAQDISDKCCINTRWCWKWCNSLLCKTERDTFELIFWRCDK